MILIDIEIEIIEVKETFEGLAVEVQTIEMLPFRTQNKLIMLGMKKVIVRLPKTKNFGENVSKWKLKLIEWKTKLEENVRDLKTVIVQSIQIIVRTKVTVLAVTIREVRKVNGTVELREKGQVTCFKL